MDHDRISKELLRTFFFEFLELFLPSLAELVDRSYEPVFLDKEDFGDLPIDLRREVDLVALLRLRLLVTQRLDRRRSGLIAHFVSSYLRLDEDEVRIYQRELESIPKVERQEIMQYTNEWIEARILRGSTRGSGCRPTRGSGCGPT